MMAKWFGANFPFIGGKENVMSRQEDERLIKNDLLQLLLTVNGERVMRPTFGTPLRQYVFEQLDTAGLDSLRASIIEAINLYENRVDVMSLTLTPTKDNNYLEISLITRMRSNPSITLNVDAKVSIGGKQ